MPNLETYYNTFNEDKRLHSRHGRLEFRTSMKYIHECLSGIEQASGKSKSQIRILDIGAGCGAYTIPLSEEGYDVTAIEPVHPNLGRLRAKATKAAVYEGNALNLKRFEAESFDLIIMFGPMYHLKTMEDKQRALAEARRVLRSGGYLLAAYIMNEYAVLTYGFTEGHIKESLKDGRMGEDFRCICTDLDLYSFSRMEDLNFLRDNGGFKTVKRFSQDGPANYMRQTVNAMEEEAYELFCRYHLSTCEREDLLGAATHVVDILAKQEDAE